MGNIATLRKWGVRLLAGFGFLIVVLLGVRLLADDSKPGHVNGYRVETPTGAKIQLSVKARGEVYIEDQKPIRARVSGVVQEVNASYGKPLEKGEVLAVIDPQKYRLELEEAVSRLHSARSDLKGIEAQLSEARTKLHRQRRLYREDLVPRKKVDRARTRLADLQAQKESAQARVRQAEISRERAQRRFDWTRIKSPIDGVLLSRNVEAGDRVSSGRPEPLFLVSPDLDEAEVRAEVTQSAVGKVEQGQPAEITTEAFPNRTFQGEVESVSPGGQKRQGVVYYEVIIQVTHSDHELLPGMTAEAKIQTGERAADQVVPIEALLFQPGSSVRERWSTDIEAYQQKGRTILWALDSEDEIRPVGVELGARDEDHVELVSGWSEPEWRIVTGK
jgi:HlyD family secretion protein